jgi:glucose/mannose-6-phosphate isomerase
MGGSAIGGDLAKDYLVDNLTVPVEVVREYDLPGYVGKRSCVVISSYSGNTEETVSAMKESLARGATLVALTTGGEVEKLAEANGIPLLRIPAGFQPREALAFSFIPILSILGSRCRDLDFEGEIGQAVEVLRSLSKRLAGPDEENEAYRLARALRDRFPVIYSRSKYFRSVVNRWRSQLAENSEVLATTHLLPELNHNEIVGWGQNREFLSRTHVIFLTDAGFDTKIRLRLDLTREILEPLAGGSSEIRSEGEGLLSRMLTLIYKGDFVSLYHSCLYGVDPTPVDKIVLLKERLSESR